MESSWIRFYYYVLLLTIFWLVQTQPYPSVQQKNIGDFKISKVVPFLIRYGYISSRSGEEKTNQIKKAIIEFQKNNGLRATGIADDQTISLMENPSCGAPDTFKLPLWNSINSETNSANKREDSFRHHSNFERKRAIYKTREKKLKRRKRFQLMGKWPKSTITYGFLSYTNKMPKAQQQNEIESALSIWSQNTPIAFEKREGKNADILLSFQRGDHGDGYPFDGPGKTLAHAFFPGPGVTNGAVHFDEEEMWGYPSSKNGTSLQAVAVHEFGHALGLGHSRNKDSVMQPYYHSRKKVLTLGEDDRRAINLLYGDQASSDNLISNQDETYVADSSVVTKTKTYVDVPECNVEFDAVANIRDEVFFFKRDRFWWITRRGEKFFNESMSRFWNNFPSKNVDAVFAKDEKTIIFSGVNYWSYTDVRMDKNYPKLISDFGLPLSGGIDAAFVWKNVTEDIYFIKGDKYWKYEKESPSRIAYGYPKNISLIGISPGIDGAFSDPQNNEVYFLKGKHCWKLDRNTLKVTEPEIIGVKWFGCKPPKKSGKDLSKTNDSKTFEPRTDEIPNSKKQAKKETGNGKGSITNYNLITTIVVVLITLMVNII